MGNGDGTVLGHGAGHALLRLLAATVQSARDVAAVRAALVPKEQISCVRLGTLDLGPLSFVSHETYTAAGWSP
jgi:hypothetical protein